MKETIRIIFLAFILAMSFGIFAVVLRDSKRKILLFLEQKIQDLEKVIQGSNMGAEKKRILIAELEASGIRVTAWMSKAIDDIVTHLNENKAWFAEVAKDTLSVASIQLADAATLIIAEVEKKLKDAVSKNSLEV